MTEQISNAGNTLVPAYLTLQSKGYQVSWKRGEAGLGDEAWFAEGPLGHFSAEDPVALLGLVAMREHRGSDGKATDEQIDEFMGKYNA